MPDDTPPRLTQPTDPGKQDLPTLRRRLDSLAERNAVLERYVAEMVAHGRRVTESWHWRATALFRSLGAMLCKVTGRKPASFLEGEQWERYVRPLAGPVLPLPTRGDGYDPDIVRIAFSDLTEDFAPHEDFAPLETTPRAIAFYLPQFHPFAENDAWWGKGFTEWTNVGRAQPQFAGHYQPHCPIHLGYYDLRIREVMEEQSRLARQYGIGGFAYYFYWFAGKVLMEQPLRQMLGNPAVDMPFCFIWANENWTRRWDGQEQDVLIAQRHSLADSRALLDHLRPYFADPRYIRVDGRPLFIIYRHEIIPDLAQTLEAWRAQAASFGLPGLYIVSATTFVQSDPRISGFDAAMQFPPLGMAVDDISATIPALDPQFSGTVYSYDQAVTRAVQVPAADYKLFPAAMLSWDNTARRKNRAHVFAGFSLTRYAQWLSANASRVAKDRRLSQDEKLIFINAWNEWAEGTHLEPDGRYGYGYLKATRRVMENYTAEAQAFLDPAVPTRRGSDFAVVVHLHFADTWPDLKAALAALSALNPDIYATVTSLDLARLVEAGAPGAVIEIVDNRGRDIRAFLHVLKKIENLGYTAICKLHGKASLHRDDGAEMRRREFASLARADLAARFTDDARLGLLVRDGSLLEHTPHVMTHNTRFTQEIATELGLPSWRGNFPAGSMFWFRPEALLPLTRLKLDDFDIERGLADGTRPHAIERLFCAVCTAQGYEVATVPTRTGEQASGEATGPTAPHIGGA